MAEAAWTRGRPPAGLTATGLAVSALALSTLALSTLAGCDPGTDLSPSGTVGGSIVAMVLADGGPEPGVTVELYAEAGTEVLNTATTGASGEASFVGLEAAIYDVVVVPPSGFMVSGDGRKTVTVASETRATVSFVLTSSTGSG